MDHPFWTWLAKQIFCLETCKYLEMRWKRTQNYLKIFLTDSQTIYTEISFLENKKQQSECARDLILNMCRIWMPMSILFDDVILTCIWFQRTQPHYLRSQWRNTWQDNPNNSMYYTPAFWNKKNIFFFALVWT